MPTKEKLAFYCQKQHAVQRKIAFKLTFEDWCAWWEMQLGKDWFSKRGQEADQYCMGRKGDKGSYSLKNIICITTAENTRQRNALLPNKGERNGSAKLTKINVDLIRSSVLHPKELAEMFGIHIRHVYRIKAKHVW